jgi:Zn finger protein HypA/HybF involved in hydrogenase expression
MGKNIVAVVLIIAVIAVVVWLVVGRGPQVQDEKLKAEREVIDCATNQLVKVTVGDWEKMEVDKATGYRIDGERRLALPHTCFSCGKPIAPVAWGGVEKDGPLELKEWEYKCPLCGDPACEVGTKPRPPDL